MKRMYAIFDSNFGSIVGGIHTFPHDAPAVRMFAQLVMDPNTMMGRYPADHDLRCLGSVDEENCLIVPDTITPTIVVTASAILASQPKAEVQP